MVNGMTKTNRVILYGFFILLCFILINPMSVSGQGYFEPDDDYFMGFEAGVFLNNTEIDYDLTPLKKNGQGRIGLYI
jgi:hypothetical protein